MKILECTMRFRIDGEPSAVRKEIVIAKGVVVTLPKNAIIQEQDAKLFDPENVFPTPTLFEKGD